MMSRRPASSPGRVEKYPPPLMRFLRSSSIGVGAISRSRSRSRGRSRSSPLFVRRSKSSSAAAVAASAAVNQEPSSPKVTCMGQVRIRRSKPQTRPGSNVDPTRRCKWIRNALLRRRFAGKLKTWSFNRAWTKWASFSIPKFRRNSKRKENSPGNEPSPRVDPDSVRDNGRESHEGEDEWENYRNPRRMFVSPASTPPRNALLLTRSRSAPYRSSSLAFRFWESDSQRETEEPNSREEAEEEDEDGERNFRSEGESIDSISRNSVQDPEPDTVTAGKTEEDDAKSEKKEETDKEASESGIVRTPALGRSKSGPARIGEKTARGWLLDEVEGCEFRRSPPPELLEIFEHDQQRSKTRVIRYAEDFLSEVGLFLESEILPP
ncbi:PREDICTED: uncharacterized protein LOC104816329 [Tarenaya hassleriana]|uniref:uncharacterized protein LOC104816329 n=1 Tax=Tarenaya hassleriana TaxID=28532 RepID=UPI00053C793D|nr:PREDICTED: uncharacterized protein LOC104816329 [Tarenaya hassleriana]